VVAAIRIEQASYKMAHPSALLVVAVNVLAPNTFRLLILIIHGYDDAMNRLCLLL
jgi:hypothetical protein